MEEDPRPTDPGFVPGLSQEDRARVRELQDEALRPPQPGDPDYDPEVDDDSRWSRCGAVHPLLSQAVCPRMLFDGEPHDGEHGFLLRWGNE